MNGSSAGFIAFDPFYFLRCECGSCENLALPTSALFQCRECSSCENQVSVTKEVGASLFQCRECSSCENHFSAEQSQSMFNMFQCRECSSCENLL